MKYGEQFDSHVDQIADVETMTEEIERKRVDPEEFRGHPFYTEAEIDQDIDKSAKLHDIFEQKRQTHTEEQKAQFERGIAAEFSLRHAIENYGWLGENVNMIIASQYDDYVRGIDSIAQIILGPERFEHLGFAIDFATGTEDVGNKLRRTFDSIDNGYTPSVKYFNSERTGKLKNFKVPRLVIGAGRESLEKLANLSMEIMNGSGIAESVKDEIRQDPFRFVLFGEIEAQLSVFINRFTKVIEKARAEKRYDIEKRALASQRAHETALRTIQELAKQSGADVKTISKHIRGDNFAEKMGMALSALSLTPIEFKKKEEGAS